MPRPPRWLMASFLALTALACSEARRPAPGYELPFGPDPFAPAEPRVTGGGLLAPAALTGSPRCGECHPEIYRQWQASLHRAAATDPFSRFAIDHNAEDYGIATIRLCTGCHEPGALLAGEIDRAVAPDGARRAEGISCLACHLVTAAHEARETGVVANASYEITPLDDALLYPDPTQGDEATRRHAEALRRPFLSQNRFCDSCHRFFIPSAWGGQPVGVLRLQSAEADGTRYGDPAAPGFRSCVDCHMPRIPGHDPAARGGTIHDHRALGANLLVPALAGDHEHVEATLAFRRAGAVRLTIGDLARDAAGDLTLPVVLANERNGHDFPTGATDISEVWAELTLTDARGEVVYRSPGLDGDRYLSFDAPSLNTVVALPGGDLDFLHDLAAQVTVRRKPRVRPDGSLSLAFAPVLPAEVVLPLQARVVLRARHGNERWNGWSFNFEAIEVPVADVAEAERALDRLPDLAVAADAPVPAVVVPEGMVLVPGGRYVIGSDPTVDEDASIDEYPPHEVQLKPFFLDRTPATFADWARAVRRGAVAPPPPMHEPPLDAYSWQDGQPPAGLDDHPVVLLTSDDAEAYCRALGKRLPHEAEWEAAAHGRDDRRYAWGDTFDPAICNTLESGRRHTVPVGSFPENASPVGALDLGCNVSEWVNESYEAYPRTRQLDNRFDWVDHFGAGFHATRGASFEHARWRSRARARGMDMAYLRKLVGVRCAADIPTGGMP